MSGAVEAFEDEDKSEELGVLLGVEDAAGKSSAAEETDDLNLPPGRMHATRVPQRLSGSACNSPIQAPSGLNHVLRKRGVDGARSRSRSPMTRKTAASGTSNPTPTQTTADANSSISSLEDIVDQDILYDRQGLVELDLTESQRKLHSSRDNICLPPVNERLSEDTLEDVHACYNT